MTKDSIKVHIKYKGIEASLEGDLETVYKEIIKWFNKILPSLQIAEKLIVDVDFQKLASKLEKYIGLSREGEVILKENSRTLSLHNKILIILSLYRIMEFTGLKKSSSITLSELSNLLNTSSKTVSSRLSELRNMGYIERIKENKSVKYKINIRGLLFIESRL